MMASWQQIVPQNGKAGPRLKLSGYHSFKIEQSPRSHKKPTSEGTQILLEITKNGVINQRHRDLQPERPIHGNLFRGDAPRPSGYPCSLDKSYSHSGQPSPDIDVIDVLRCPNCDARFERGGKR